MNTYLIGIAVWLIGNIAMQSAQDREVPSIKYLTGAIITGLVWPLSLVIVIALGIGQAIADSRK